MSIFEKVAPISYGCDEVGRLQSVLVHTPGEELGLINEANCRAWQFEAAPDVGEFAVEHQQLVLTLEDHGVETFRLTEFVQSTSDEVGRLPGLTYLEDVATISGRGAILSRMATEGRRGEEGVVKEALATLGVPVWHEFDSTDDAFEGCLALSRAALLVADREGRRAASIRKLARAAWDHFEEIVYVDLPDEPRFGHPRTVLNMIAPNLAMAYLPVFERTRLLRRGSDQPVDFSRYLAERGIEVIGLSDSEQRRKGCGFLPLESGVLFHFDTALDRPTLGQFVRRGVDLILFHPDALLAGSGGLSSLALQLCRRPPCPVQPSTGGEWE